MFQLRIQCVETMGGELSNVSVRARYQYIKFDSITFGAHINSTRWEFKRSTNVIENAQLMCTPVMDSSVQFADTYTYKVTYMRPTPSEETDIKQHPSIVIASHTFRMPNSNGVTGKLYPKLEF